MEVALEESLSFPTWIQPRLPSSPFFFLFTVNTTGKLHLMCYQYDLQHGLSAGTKLRALASPVILPSAASWTLKLYYRPFFFFVPSRSKGHYKEIFKDLNGCANSWAGSGVKNELIGALCRKQTRVKRRSLMKPLFTYDLEAVRCGGRWQPRGSADWRPSSNNARVKSIPLKALFISTP